MRYDDPTVLSVELIKHWRDCPLAGCPRCFCDDSRGERVHRDQTVNVEGWLLDRIAALEKFVRAWDELDGYEETTEASAANVCDWSDAIASERERRGK